MSANNHMTLSPTSTIMMDGSVNDITPRDCSETLRHRAVNKVPEGLLEPIEMVKNDLETNNRDSEDKLQENADDGDDESQSFPENTFSFLLIARYPLFEKARPEHEEGTNKLVRKRKTRDYLCIPFWFASGVLILQIFIYTLALDNATEFSDDKNPFSVPIDVDPTTRAAEFVAVLITIYTEDNLFQGVHQFVQSFDAVAETPGVTKVKYYFSATTQVVVGLYGIFVTFIIIMQAEGVVDLLLDFTAMEFVAKLDDAAFFLAIGGFFGTPMKKTANVVKNSTYAPRAVRKWLRKWPMFLLFAIVMACYVIIRVKQDNRAFGDNEIYVQFHDDVIPWMSTLSGIYIGCHLPLSDHSRITKGKNYKLGRTIYTTLPVPDCQKNWKKGHGAFFFCDQKHWVFAASENKTNPCEKWAMKSIKPNAEGSDEYDIMTHSSEVWLVRHPSKTSGTDVVEEIEFLAGFKHSQDVARNCSVLASTGNVFSFPFYARVEESVQQKSFSTERPVYFAGDDVDGEYIFHTGRRWVVVKSSELPECVRNCKKLPETCCKFDPYTSNYTVSFISDPMDLRRIEDTWIPTSDLIWYSSSGTAKASKPIVKRQSLVDQIDMIEALSSVVSFPTGEEREKLIDLHLQSARLSCLCDGGDLECEKTVACGADETTVWIDLQTDNRPQDTFFLVAANETWFDFEDKASSSFTFSSVRQDVERDPIRNLFLNKTGYFDWQNVWKSGFDAKSNYQYTTCLPKNNCGFVYIEDLAGNSITFPGRFNVFLNTRQMERVAGGRFCLYDLCQESVTCSDNSLLSELFNPEVECADDFVPLAFQYFKDTSVSVSNSSDWLANAEMSIGAFYDTLFEWQPIEFDMKREFWSDVDFLAPGQVGYLFDPVRTTTCMPKETCAVVEFQVLDDVPVEKVFSGDTYPFERPIVIYNGTEIGSGDDEESNFARCIYQFGDACSTEIVCSDVEISRPYTSDIQCNEGEKPLAVQIRTDKYAVETNLLFTELKTWTEGVLTDAATLGLNESGTFEWGLLRSFYPTNTEEGAEPALYSFDTCVPDDVCGVAILGDSYTDGIVNGGMTLVYDNKEMLLGPRGDKFSNCVFQFGDCETQLTCYDSADQLPIYNPEIECQSGTPLAFDLQATYFTYENTIFVTDLDSWNEGSSESFPSLDAEGFFTWGSKKIDHFGNGPFHRFSTCVPSDVCVVLAVTDAYGDGFESGRGFTAVYNRTEIMQLKNDEFTECVVQLGACEKQIVCSTDLKDPLDLDEDDDASV